MYVTRPIPLLSIENSMSNLATIAILLYLHLHCSLNILKSVTILLYLSVMFESEKEKSTRSLALMSASCWWMSKNLELYLKKMIEIILSLDMQDV